MNREKFEAELGAAGIRLKALDDDGRAVLLDGTIVPSGWDGDSTALSREDRFALTTDMLERAWAYRRALLAHDPTPTSAQEARAAREAVRAPALLEALALLAATTTSARRRAEAQAVVNAVAARLS